VGVLGVVPLTLAIGAFAPSGAFAASQPQALVPHCAAYFPMTQTQICSVAFGARAGKLMTDVVAKYADYSNCNFPAPASEPGENDQYVVAKVSIAWGDGSAASTGVAHRGTSCPGTSVLNSPGEIESVTGVHRYEKPGTFHVTVTIIYLRGAGDTYQNCASVTGAQTYNAITNCIALAAPARSVAVVRAS
jgi:hypothetical protein